MAAKNKSQYNDVVIAGFGGQGVLLSGKILAWAGMLDGRHVTWFPSYGAEMRGGTANCTVVMSSDVIGSPVVDRPGALVALNQESYDKFAARVDKGGVIVVNSSLARNIAPKNGVNVVKVPANDFAEGLGNPRVINIVMLGAYLGATNAATAKAVVKAISAVLPERHKSLLDVNVAALRLGISLGEK